MEALHGADWKSKLQPLEQEYLRRKEESRAKWLRHIQEAHPEDWQAVVAEHTKAAQEKAASWPNQKLEPNHAARRAFWSPEQWADNQDHFEAREKVKKDRGVTKPNVPMRFWGKEKNVEAYEQAKVKARERRMGTQGVDRESM